MKKLLKLRHQVKTKALRMELRVFFYKIVIKSSDPKLTTLKTQKLKLNNKQKIRSPIVVILHNLRHLFVRSLMIVISLVDKRILKTVVKDFCFYNILQGNYI